MRLTVAVVLVLFFLPVLAHADKFKDGLAAAFFHEDYLTALKNWMPLAEQGNAQAQAGVGVLCNLGLGLKQDQAAAVKWYLASAGRGYAPAQVNLGTMYEKGQGVKQDHMQAMKWFRKAADQGDKRGQCFIGQMYADGSGVDKDDAEAARWYRKAGGYLDVCTHFSEGSDIDKINGLFYRDTRGIHWLLIIR